MSHYFNKGVSKLQLINHYPKPHSPLIEEYEKTIKDSFDYVFYNPSNAILDDKVANNESLKSKKRERKKIEQNNN